MPVLGAPWWRGFVAALSARPLGELARERGVSEETAIDALIEADEGGPAQDAPWWPEAVRLRHRLTVYAIARRFDTEPRRIRVAFAQEGYETGEDADSDRPFARRPAADRLPELARAAGLGDRRADAAPGRPGAPSLSLTEEEEAWIRGDELPRRPRLRQDNAAFEVVRRPVRGAERSRAPEPSFGPPAADRPAGAELARPADAPRRDFEREPPNRRFDRTFFRETRRDDLERLLQPSARPRDGRQRIVRAEAPRGAGADSGGPLPFPDVFDAPAVVAPPPTRPPPSDPAPPRPSPAVGRPAAPAPPQEPRVAPEAAPPASRPVSVTAPPRSAASNGPPPAPPRRLPAPAPSTPVSTPAVAALPVATQPLPAPRVAVTPAPAPPPPQAAPPAPVPARAAPAAGLARWLVEVSDGSSLSVEAVDLPAAAAAVRAQVGADPGGVVRIQRDGVWVPPFLPVSGIPVLPPVVQAPAFQALRPLRG